MEEGIIYAFILCILIFSVIDGVYRVKMKKDVDCMHSMLHDICHMLFDGATDSEIAEHLENHRHNQDEIEAWDKS